MKFIALLKTLARYWRMTKDPRTPPFVRYLIYGGIAYTLSPVDLLPDFVPGLGLLDDAAVLPSIIALAMLFVPKEVKEDHDAKEEREIKTNKIEGKVQGDVAEAKDAVRKGEVQTVNAKPLPPNKSGPFMG